MESEKFTAVSKKPYLEILVCVTYNTVAVFFCARKRMPRTYESKTLLVIQNAKTCSKIIYKFTCKLKAEVHLLGRHGSDSLCRDERENKMAATYNVLAFKR